MPCVPAMWDVWCRPWVGRCVFRGPSGRRGGRQTTLGLVCAVWHYPCSGMGFPPACTMPRPLHMTLDYPWTVWSLCLVEMGPTPPPQPCRQFCCVIMCLPHPTHTHTHTHTPTHTHYTHTPRLIERKTHTLWRRRRDVGKFRRQAVSL